MKRCGGTKRLKSSSCPTFLLSKWFLRIGDSGGCSHLEKLPGIQGRGLLPSQDAIPQGIRKSLYCRKWWMACSKDSGIQSQGWRDSKKKDLCLSGHFSTIKAGLIQSLNKSFRHLFLFITTRIKQFQKYEGVPEPRRFQIRIVRRRW